jgi:hypothetical protein
VNRRAKNNAERCRESLGKRISGSNRNKFKATFSNVCCVETEEDSDSVWTQTNVFVHHEEFAEEFAWAPQPWTFFMLAWLAAGRIKVYEVSLLGYSTSKSSWFSAEQPLGN